MPIAYTLWNWPVQSHTFVINEVRWMVRHGIDVRVLFKNKPGPPDVAADLDFEVEAHQLPDLEQFARRVKELGISHMHTHFIYPPTTLITLPLAEKTGVPFSCIGHGRDLFLKTHEEKARLSDIGKSPHCRVFLAPGSFHRNYLIAQGVPAAKIVIFPQLTQLEQYAGYDRGLVPEVKRVVTISRFVEKKGFKVLVEAVRRLPKTEFRFEFYGYGPLEEYLRAEAENLPNLSIHPGPTLPQQTAEILSRADLFVLPCVVTEDGDSDGLPTVLEEAMAVAVPVLSTPVASIGDLVIDGETGYLCPTGNVEALANRLVTIAAQSADQRRSIALRGKEFVLERFNPDINYRRLLDLWQV